MSVFAAQSSTPAKSFSDRPMPASAGGGLRLVRRSARPRRLLDELGTPTRGAFHPRLPASQLSALLRRPAHLADRHLDAVGRRVVAGLPPDRLVGAARRHLVRHAQSRSSCSRHRRHGRRSLPPPPHHPDTQTASMLLAFVLAALTLSGRVQVWHVFVLATCLGIVNAFDIPARQAFVVEMVGREDLDATRSRSTRRWSTARGSSDRRSPGCWSRRVGEGWCFLLNAVSYVAVIAGLLLMRVPPRPQPAARSVGAARDARRLPVRRARRRRCARCSCCSGIVSFAGMPYAVLMPIFADRSCTAGRRGSAC